MKSLSRRKVSSVIWSRPVLRLSAIRALPAVLIHDSGQVFFDLAADVFDLEGEPLDIDEIHAVPHLLQDVPSLLVLEDEGRDIHIAGDLPGFCQKIRDGYDRADVLELCLLRMVV